MLSNLIANVLPLILSQVSPSITQALEATIQTLAVKARQTPNPYDDLLVDLLLTVLRDINVPPAE